jgi:hypothetical protein
MPKKICFQDIQARLLRITRLIEAGGVHKYAKHLEGPVWEIRIKGRDGIARACLRVAARNDERPDAQ